MALIDDAIIAVYDARAAAIAQANRLKSAQTFGTALTAAGAAPAAKLATVPAALREITLELLSNVNVPATPAVAAVPATATSPASPAVKAQAAHTELQGTSVTFTVAWGSRSDGFLQRISITAPARQSVHQTVVGNYVDEWNMAVGRLDLDAIMVYAASPTPGAQVQMFFDLIQKAKTSTPLSNDLPSILRYHDSVLQRSFIITQNNLTFVEDVERPHQARITISADILYDYGVASFSAQKVTQSPVPDSFVQSLAQSLKSFG